LSARFESDADNAKGKAPAWEGEVGALGGRNWWGLGDLRPTPIQYISRGGDVTRITSFRFPLTVSKRVNSSKADAHDVTLIDGAALAIA